MLIRSHLITLPTLMRAGMLVMKIIGGIFFYYLVGLQELMFTLTMDWLILFPRIWIKIKAPTFVNALSVAPPLGLSSNHLLKDLRDFHLLYKEIQAYQKLPSLN